MPRTQVLKLRARRYNHYPPNKMDEVLEEVLRGCLSVLAALKKLFHGWGLVWFSKKNLHHIEPFVWCTAI